MIALMGLVSACAAGALVVSGYLFGARRGLGARDALRAELAHAASANGAEHDLRALRAELSQFAGALLDRTRTQSLDGESLRRDLQHMMTPLLQRDNDSKGLREAMRELVGPLLERERLGKELSQLDTKTGALGELPRLLDSIVDKGGFASVILSDEVGLPIAASAGAHDVEMYAGVSALLLTMTDRVVASGAAAPTAIVIHDTANQNVVYRTFQAGGARYMLTGVTRGMFLSPEALDPALAKLEKVLTKEEAWS